MKPLVTIVIVNWNNWGDSIECLESVFHLDYENYHVVLCDNDSSDGSVEKIIQWANGKLNPFISEQNPLKHLLLPIVTKPISYQLIESDQIATKPLLADEITAQSSLEPIKAHPQLTLIQTGANRGFAGGNNVGIKYAIEQDCDYIWLLNNDTVVEPDCLSQMLLHSQQKDSPNTCGSTIMHYYQPSVVQALGGNRYNKWTGLASSSLGRGLSIDTHIDHPTYQRQLSYISGASWLLPKAFINDIGLMEESYFLYCEEIDWCIRNQGKYDLTYAPTAKVYHKEGGSIGSPNLEKPSSLFSDFFIFRNKLRFTRRFFPEALLSNYLVSLIQLFNRLRRGQFDKAELIWNILLGRDKVAAKMARVKQSLI